MLITKRLWCWEGLGAGGEGDDRGWDGWMASPTRWTWVWVNSGSWWWTGRPGVLWFMGSQRVGHDWVTDLIWSDLRGSFGKINDEAWCVFIFQKYQWGLQESYRATEYKMSGGKLSATRKNQMWCHLQAEVDPKPQNQTNRSKINNTFSLGWEK